MKSIEELAVLEEVHRQKSLRDRALYSEGVPSQSPGSRSAPWESGFLVWFDGAEPPLVQELEIPEVEDRVDVPIWGTVEAADVSLPLFTFVIAAADSFNPCAFFVLLFLLSLLVHAQSRLRMAVIGGLFVLASAAVYFGFMAAWLNLFLFVGFTTSSMCCPCSRSSRDSSPCSAPAN